jgi:hypothetical protein
VVPCCSISTKILNVFNTCYLKPRTWNFQVGRLGSALAEPNKNSEASAGVGFHFVSPSLPLLFDFLWGEKLHAGGDRLLSQLP